MICCIVFKLFIINFINPLTFNPAKSGLYCLTFNPAITGLPRIHSIRPKPARNFGYFPLPACTLQPPTHGPHSATRGNHG